MTTPNIARLIESSEDELELKVTKPEGKDTWIAEIVYADGSNHPLYNDSCTCELKAQAFSITQAIETLDRLIAA
jgi:hypothetical protein